MRLIDADALMELFDERLDKAHIQVATRRTGKTLWSGIHGGVNWCRNTIIEAPTIEAEPVRHGRWVNDLDENGFLCSAWRKCSVCGGLNFSKRPPYCPNCGAKMDGDSHD